MRYAPPRLRRAAARWLEHEAGEGHAGSADLTASCGRLMDRLSQRLAHVIGPAGVEAIFLRAVKLRQAEFPFLDERIVPRGAGDSLGEPLRTCLQGQSPDVTRDVTVVLVATFAGLLATVIGDRLAGSLLRDIGPVSLWPEVEPQEAEE